ncbi:hypothetical protein ISS96_03305 [Candidatus Bathyarchaeota archaeon]|nr:hypothetical protein [Candidatus Bathyarchaeota archaeon]
MQSEITYFDSPGPENTEQILDLAKKRAEELGIRNILVATSSGRTGALASRIYRGYDLIAVSHHTGFRSPGVQELQEGFRNEILANGAKILTASHALSGVERAVRKQLGSILPLEIMAHTLRTFGQGMKVCVEITVMAADAGLIPIDSDVIAIGGTSKGADTAAIIKPAHSNNFFDLTVREIVAKPRTR